MHRMWSILFTTPLESPHKYTELQDQPLYLASASLLPFGIPYYRLKRNWNEPPLRNVTIKITIVLPCVTPPVREGGGRGLMMKVMIWASGTLTSPSSHFCYFHLVWGWWLGGIGQWYCSPQPLGRSQRSEHIELTHIPYDIGIHKNALTYTYTSMLSTWSIYPHSTCPWPPDLPPLETSMVGYVQTTYCKYNV